MLTNEPTNKKLNELWNIGKTIPAKYLDRVHANLTQPFRHPGRLQLRLSYPPVLFPPPMTY